MESPDIRIPIYKNSKGPFTIDIESSHFPFFVQKYLLDDCLNFSIQLFWPHKSAGFNKSSGLLSTRFKFCDFGKTKQDFNLKVKKEYLNVKAFKKLILLKDPIFPTCCLTRDNFKTTLFVFIEPTCRESFGLIRENENELVGYLLWRRDTKSKTPDAFSSLFTLLPSKERV